MAAAQEWCLECGAGMPEAFDRRPAWRSTAAIIGIAVVLAAGAVAASYAALNSDSHRAVTQPVTVTAPTAAVDTAPAASTPAPATPPAAAAPAKPTTPAPKPKPAPAPAATTPAATTPAATTPAVTTPATASTPSTTSAPGTTAPQPGTGTKILLDTDAASTYNPYGYDPSRFGDPANAIDGDQSTMWTASTDPATAPHLAVGLLLDLKSLQRVGKLDLVTSTPGMTIAVYGTSSTIVPPSITDPSWVHLAPQHLAKRHDHLTLRAGGTRMRYLLVWITKAPATAPAPAGSGTPTSSGTGTGTPAASVPGFVAINEESVIR
jgi:hypothetical protein